jgi:serine/threonine-protein kinase
VFFECVTGRRPIDVDSRDLDSWARAHRAERVPVEMAPVPVQALISRGLAKDPAQRPAQALAFAAELEQVALQVYGPDWERIGRQVIIGALTGLAATGVLLSLVPGLVPGLAGPAVPLPLPAPPALPSPISGTPGFPSPTPGTPGFPSPTLGQPAPHLPPGTPGAPPAPATPTGPGYPSAPQAPTTPGHPSAPQHPYPRPRVPRHHPWRHLQAKLGTGKVIATVTAAAVVTVAGGTAAIVLATTQKSKTPTPALAVPTASPGTAPTTSSVTSPPALALGSLTGDWSAHSAGLSIKPDGTFTVFQRIYGSTDTMDTAHGTGRLTTAANGTADGEITQSDTPTGDGAIPLGAVHLTFSSDNDTVQIKLSDNDSYTFCGLNAPSGFCGA